MDKFEKKVKIELYNDHFENEFRRISNAER